MCALRFWIAKEASRLSISICYAASELYRRSYPQRHGGLGLGIDPGGASALFTLLRSIGQGNLAVGRIFEGHANAIKLINTFGSEAQIEKTSEDVRAGHLFAIWNAETKDGIRILDNNKLSGAKTFCSGAGYVTRALITAKDRSGTALVTDSA